MDEKEISNKNDQETIPVKLTGELRAHYVEMLITLYEMEPALVNKMTDAELITTLRQKEIVKMQKVRNPNSFWILKSLPPPKETKPTTSPKFGMWVVLSLFIALLVFLAIALLVVFLK